MGKRVTKNLPIKGVKSKQPEVIIYNLTSETIEKLYGPVQGKAKNFGGDYGEIKINKQHS